MIKQKIGLWLLMLSLTQTSLAATRGSAHTSKKKAAIATKKADKQTSKVAKRKITGASAPQKVLTKNTSNSIESSVVERGQACIYSDDLHGTHTATGERFNKEALTAAHINLPLGSKIRVTSLENGKSVIVRVNDRGPFSPKYILDMSPAAAKKIGLNFDKGVMKIKIERVKRYSN